MKITAPLHFKLPNKFQLQLPFLTSVRFVDKLLFTKHMSMMLKTDTTLFEALEILESLTDSHPFEKMLHQIIIDVKSGKSLSASMGNYPKVFDAFYSNIISVGESSGTLDESFSYLAIQLAKEYSFRKIVQGAMIYPLIVLIAVGGVGMGVSIFVLPQLLNLFSGFGASIPESTKLLIAFATLMENDGILVIICIALVILAGYYITRWRKTKPFIDRMLFEIPYAGKIIENVEATVFCRNLGTLLKSGLPINSALVVVLKISTNYLIQYYVVFLLGATEKGKSLAEEFEIRQFKHFPKLMTKMISVGEKTGNLADTMLYLGNFYEEEVNNSMRNISTVLEPIMLLVIGGIVAFIALAIISPIYQITGSVGQ